ncbi:chromate efflux transporter [Caulobacter sp. SLTY]|uniref:chromate efflux transporter n=1 Tax=Caulobacter sp. SLTY TaxID=2683262 RepID=UPI0014137913|nr:chromate efflux transporter [Caulobacter sp. SLTY]NBB14962.1 chromate efflux transporter [Caulobacter sp. SLTY]
MTDTPLNIPSFRDLVAASARVGFLGFGGPAGQIALMHRVFVDEKKWIDEPRYLHALSYCTLLPGPEAQQLATYVGWLLHGVRGGLAAGLLFVLPGAVLVTALAWLYAAHGEAPWLEAAFWGVKAAVLALVAEALQRVGKRALKGRGDLVIAILAFVALAVFSAPFPLVILVAAGVGLAMSRSKPSVAREKKPAVGVGRTVRTTALWLAIWLIPLAAVVLVFGPDHWLSRVGEVFAALAAVTFGGAYAMLAWLQQQAVEVQGWLTTAQMIDGLGLAETTPGPLVLVNGFVGFMAGWNNGGWAWGLAGAAMALWQTFAPSFLYIFAGAPYAERLRQSPAATGLLRAVTAAVLGVIASLALWFALHVVFGSVTDVATPWGGKVGVPVWASFDPWALGLALAAGAALIRFHVNVVVVILACAGVGLARWAAGL